MHRGLGCRVKSVRDIEDALQQCCSTWLDIASSSYGPHGRPKILQAHDAAGASIITSTSGRIAQGTHTRDHLSTLLTRSTISSQSASYGDGGLLSIMLACRLVLDALRTTSGHAARLELVTGYQTAIRWLSEAECGQGATDPDPGPSSSSHAAASTQPAQRQQQDTCFNSQGEGAMYQSSPTARGPPSSLASAATTRQDQRSAQVEGSGPGPPTEQGNVQTLAHQAPHPLSVVLSVDASGVQAYVAVVRTILCSKPAASHWTEQRARQLCTLVVQAFLASLPEHPLPAGSTTLPPVRTLTVLGLPQQHSFVKPGLVLDLPVSPACLELLPLQCTSPAGQPDHTPSPGLVVALFDISLEPSRPHADGTAESLGLDQGRVLGTGCRVELLQIGADGWSPQDAELQELMAMVQQLRTMGVRVLASQKIIHESIQRAALSLGMLPLQRLSILHVHALAATCGAVPISSAQPAASWRSFFGMLGCVRQQELAGKTLLVLEPAPAPSSTIMSAAAPQAWERQRPVHSLVLGCSSELQAEELRPAVEAALRALQCLLAYPRVLPGGGCAEALMAAYLRHRAGRVPASHLSRLQGAAVSQVASALEAFAALLVQSEGGLGGALEAVQSLAEHVQQQLAGLMAGAHSSSTIEFIGWDAGAGMFAPVATARVGAGTGGYGGTLQRVASVSNAVLLDASRVKLSAIVSGIEAACMLLRLDGQLTPM